LTIPFPRATPFFPTSSPTSLTRDLTPSFPPSRFGFLIPFPLHPRPEPSLGPPASSSPSHTFFWGSRQRSPPSSRDQISKPLKPFFLLSLKLHVRPFSPPPFFASLDPHLTWCGRARSTVWGPLGDLSVTFVKFFLVMILPFSGALFFSSCGNCGRPFSLPSLFLPKCPRL